MPTQIPMFEPSERDMLELAWSVSPEEKVENSINFLRLHGSGAIMCDSYGKDSGCIDKLCDLAGIEVTRVHSLTTLDPPELMRFGRKYRKRTEVRRQPKSMLHRMLDRPSGPPTRMIRWCCEEYKENTGNGNNKIIGVRAAESKRREGWKQVVIMKDKKAMFCPILYWTDEDVWWFHREYKIPYCELYDMGFKRLGCVGCPMTSIKQRKIEFERWPRYEMLWREFITRYWLLWKDEPKKRGEGKRMWSYFKSGDEMFDWWMGEAKQEDSGCQMDFMYT